MGYMPMEPASEFANDPVHRAIQRIIHCSRLTVTSVQEHVGHLHQIYVVQLSNRSRLVLKVEPPPTTFLLRHERQQLDTEATILKRLFKGNLPIPQVIMHEQKTTSLGSPFLVITHLEGITYGEAIRYLTCSERSSVDQEIRSMISYLCQETFPTFGPAGNQGHKNWREAFNSMLESILMDGEDAMVNIPYFQIRTAMSRWDCYLDDVTEANLVVPGLGLPENVLIDRKTNEITGLLDFGQAFWGDPGVVKPESCDETKSSLWVEALKCSFDGADC